MGQLKAIVMGASAGGLNALQLFLERIPQHFRIPVFIVLHVSPQSDDSWVWVVGKKSKILVKEGEDKEPIQEGRVYLAPPDYHMLISYDHTIALSKDPKVNFSRPSIDVLFESASEVYQGDLAGIVLTGSNTDGVKGLEKIKGRGGITIVQNPVEAEYKEMPEAALKAVAVDQILRVEEIADFLLKCRNNN